MKTWLRAQPDQPATIAELQALLDVFVDIYNTHRPHRSLPSRSTPAVAYAARPKATPGDRTHDTHYRVRHDRVDTRRHRHPARQRPPPPHRHRPRPRPNPRRPAHRRPRHPHHRRRHRRTPPPPHPRPHPRLPAPRPTTRTPTPKTTTARTPNGGSGRFRCLETSHGADDGIRTPDPFHAMEVLCQLSYSPVRRKGDTSGARGAQMSPVQTG